MINVCIVGLGLMGGSLGQALRRVTRDGRRRYFVRGWGRTASKLARAKRLRAVDVWSTCAEDVIPGSDVVVFCVPVQDMTALAKTILPHLKRGAILTDVGSIKAPVMKAMKSLLKTRSDLAFVGCHPLAGSEKSGIEFASPRLYVEAICALVAGGPERKPLRLVKSMWASVGAKPLVIDAASHDRVLALTSHLPHLLAFALFQMAFSQAKKNPLLPRLVAGSFRDMTRVAGSHPRLWSGIISGNKQAVRQAAKHLHKVMLALLSSTPRRLESSLQQIARQKLQWK